MTIIARMSLNIYFYTFSLFLLFISIDITLLSLTKQSKAVFKIDSKAINNMKIPGTNIMTIWFITWLNKEKFKMHIFFHPFYLRRSREF